MTTNTGFAKENDSENKLQFELTTTDVADNISIYLTGNFNNWLEKDERFKLDKISDQKYYFEFSDKSLLPNPLTYKYIRGSWNNVELDLYGNSVENRSINPLEGLVQDHVPRWKRDGKNFKEDFLPEIQVISEQFEIPQLIKTRRISALLPYNYQETDRRYPVLYLQDGQNLFDDFAPFGNWSLDKKLAILAEMGLGDLIVIAIDHAEEERIEEFTPSYKTKLGRGEGKKYTRFLADTLKPYIDLTFRTLGDRENTGIGGSSMGGLISIYAGMMYPEVYSKLMIFSPSLWVAPNIHFHAINFDESLDTRIYLYGGAEESVNMIPNLKRFKQTIEQQGVGANIDFNLSIDPNGKHNEARWGEEFPKAIEWLFNNN